MSEPTIRVAYSVWPTFNERLRDAVTRLTDEQLALKPTPERWPLWATVGHLACQRVSWLCGFAGEPGAGATPFPNALYECPGDEYLDPPLSATELGEALESTFRIIEGVLDGWTVASLDEEIRQTWQEEVVHTRGWVVQRAFGHDVWHMAELNEAFARNGLPLIDPWS